MFFEMIVLFIVLSIVIGIVVVSVLAALGVEDSK